MSLLEVSNLRFKYTDKELYNNAEFRILDGDHIVIVGPNGCGKSTFLNIIAKNIIPDSGKVEWDTPYYILIFRSTAKGRTRPAYFNLFIWCL